MKWVALGLMLMAIPLVVMMLRSDARREAWVYVVFAFLSLLVSTWKLYAAPYATPMWPGFVKGWEFSLLDSLSIGILIGIRGPRPPAAILATFAMYFVTVLLSVTQAKFPFFALSYPLQLVRVALAVLAATKVAGRPHGERALLVGIAAGLLVHLAYAVVAKLYGSLQTGGGFPHQNLLGFITHMTVLPLFAGLLAGRLRLMGGVGLAAGLLLVALTASRATLIISGFGLTLTLVMSLVLRFKGGKMGYASLFIVLACVAVPLAVLNVERRLVKQGSAFIAEDKTRAAFEKAALMMVSERPGGVGPNSYTFVAITEGYSARAGVNWSTDNRSAIVHNAYLLELAESGYLGLITLVVFLSTCLLTALRSAWAFRRSGDAETLIGVSCGLLAIMLHNFFEWIFFSFIAQYPFAILVGLLSGIVARKRAEAQAHRATRRPQVLRSTAAR